MINKIKEEEIIGLTVEEIIELSNYFKEEIELLKSYCTELTLLSQKTLWDLSRARRYLRKVNGIGLERFDDISHLKDLHIAHSEINKEMRKVLDKLLKIVQVEKEY